MISTKSILTENLYPVEWVFENYLNLNVLLEGQDVRIKSIFNPHDKDPSMIVYYDKTNEDYRFNDFSSGKKGCEVTLVMNIFGLDYNTAQDKIIADFEEYCKLGIDTTRVFKAFNRYRVSDFKTRLWRTIDAKFWMSYHIDSETLDFFSILPLEYYTMSNGDHTFTVKQDYIYGYFRLDGTLYKLYQPKNKSKKYIKNGDYIQGTDQLEYKRPFLLIGSGLKDLCALKKLSFDVELVAPDSENTMIKPDMITTWKSRYKAICTIFDNDEAGIKSMIRYQEEYNLPFVHLKIEKDVADASKAIGLIKLKQEMYPLLKDALKSYTK